MGLVAAIAAALAAVAAAAAVGGYQLGSVSVPPALYALAFVPGLVSVAARRVPPALPRVDLSPGNVRLLRFAVIGGALVVVSASSVPTGAAGAVTTAAAVAAAGLGYWWPLPAAIRLSVAMSVLALARPDANPTDHVAALVVLGPSASVALVACSRLADARLNVLGGQRSRHPQGRRVGAEAAVVALALLLGALLAARMDSQQPSAPQPQAGDLAERRPPEPLEYLDVLDPNEAGPGGRGQDPDEVLLKVDADRAGVLRALTFDQWDGHRWQRSEHIRGTGEVLERFVPVRNTGVRSPDGISEQRVRVEAPYAAVAVGTPHVYVYEVPGGGEPALDGSVRLEPALGKGAEYTAQTARNDASPDELRATVASESALSDESDEFTDPNEHGDSDELRPPGDENPNVTAGPVLSARARALVERLTAGVVTDYDKVATLSARLSHVTVDGDAPALGPDADPVDSVLFGTEPVSPVRLATTLAVLTRAAGVPSRMATGFLPGQRPFFGGDFVVRAGDAHAWVEVPFPGYGWVRFDPSGRIAAAEKQDSLWERLKRVWERFWPVFVLIAVLVAAYVVRRLVLRRRRLAAIPWATRFYARLMRLGDKRGRPRRPAETPAEYTAALAEGVLADERLVEVGRVLTAAAWSGREPAPDTRSWADQVLAEAAQASRPAHFDRFSRSRTPADRS